MLFKSALSVALSAAAFFTGTATARSITPGVQTLYNALKGGSCSKILKSGFKDGQTSNTGVKYCADDSTGTMWIAGNGQLADMDIDCDGANNSAGLCANDPSGQGQTAFMDTVKNYGISDLNSNIHGYVVLGNEGSSPSFDPQSYGIKPLSVVVVVCNGQIHYGVWGDTNGGVVTGEASISLATACFPNEGITGDSGHGAHDVLYLAFKDPAAATTATNVNWKATSFSAFESSLATIGDQLIARFGGGGTTPPPTCSWEGHCAGASCSTDDDCSDDLTCNGGICGTAGSTPPPPTCSWEGHCLGASCSTGDDCSDDLICTNGKCANP